MSQDGLESCDVCGKKISKAAESCPHCGDPKYQDSQLAGCGRAVMNLVIIAGAFWIVITWLF